jgi:hypothetical protein
MSWMFLESLLLYDARVFSCDARVCAMPVNLGKEHDVEHDDGYYGYCCSARISTLVEEMESGVNALHDFGALFLWDVRQG